MGRSPHLIAAPLHRLRGRACGPFLLSRNAPHATPPAFPPLAARPPVAVITARGAAPKPPGCPPRPACGLARCFPTPCPSKPATPRLAASLARPVTAPAPACRLASPPRAAEARQGVTARPGAPKPATGRGSPLPPARRPASPPCPPAVRLAAAPGAPPAPSAVAARPPGAPAVRLPLARRRPPWRGDHRPPPPGAPPPGPPAGPARKKGVKNRNFTRQPRIKHGCKKVVKNPYCKFFASRNPCKNPFLQLGFIMGSGGIFWIFPYFKKVFLARLTSAFLRRL
jgi:hypothetical protein